MCRQGEALSEVKMASIHQMTSTWGSQVFWRDWHRNWLSLWGQMPESLRLEMGESIDNWVSFTMNRFMKP